MSPTPLNHMVQDGVNFYHKMRLIPAKLTNVIVHFLHISALQLLLYRKLYVDKDRLYCKTLISPLCYLNMI